MSRKLTASLREAPATVPALVAMALFVVWSTDQAGFPVTHWALGALIVLALLGVALGFVGVPEGMPLPVRIALACLAAYTALSFLSILWAGVPGDAWEGANRTLLYLLVFALFACWRQQRPSALLLLGGWTLAMVALAAFVALHLSAAAGASLQSLIPGGRLVYPSGYANANAAQWLMAFWPALLLARSERLHWALRGVLAGGAVLLALLALLSQSRGSLYATAVMLVIVFALLPGRVRTFALLVPVAAGIGLAAPAVLRVGDNLNPRTGGAVAQTLHSATVAAFAAALGTGLVVAFAAAIESRAPLSPRTRARIRTTIGALAITTLVAVLAGGWAAAGDPLVRIRHGWDSFKGGYSTNSSTPNRLISGLGSNRYDFYRVALNEFLAHPLLGIGADNFQQQYLAHGRSEETPHYPHSVELRTLVQTGLAGTLLALLGLGAALLACARACRRSIAGGGGSAGAGAGAGVAAAAVAGFSYWLVHGSFDWLWEFAGLGAPAFALLGLACSLAPSTRSRRFPLAGILGSRRLRFPLAGILGSRRLRYLAGALLALGATASLALPWLSRLEVERAAKIWPSSPRQAYARLNDAADLNPLSDEPALVAGAIALRFGDLARAAHEFSLALARVPRGAYATLEQGAIAATRGDREEALRLLERAVGLSPREPLAREALSRVREGRGLSIEELNRSILSKAQQLG
ncbi:MAG: O-antigen ligase family protein [Solirubrobacteraceae bacterium]|jgi:O-antigen ligase